MKEIAIIGGGAAGLFFSVYLKEQLELNNIKDVTIVIYERLERTGKKLLVTGNGRCNYSNINLNKNKYNHPEFVNKIIKDFNVKNLIEYFKSLGLYSMTDKEGRVYPQSEMANTVLDVLRTKLRIYGIEERCNTEVRKITNVGNKFIIETGRNVRNEADLVVLATGGKASQIHGSNGTGYTILKGLKHKIVDPKPGLVGIKTDEAQVKGLAGVRVKANVSLYDKKQKKTVWNEFGEVQFKLDGLSGIVVMQLASFTQHNPAQYVVSLDLMPNVTWDDLFIDIKQRIKDFGQLENTMVLTGMFNKMINLAILKKAKVDMSGYAKNITDREVTRIVDAIKEFKFDYKGNCDFDKAQVTVGGADLTEFNDKTLESKKVKNLYCLGELLDVDGECGGYNLHWAFASSVAAAKDIIKKL